MKKSPLQQRKIKKTLKCKEGYSMQTRMDSKGQPMRDPDGKIIKSCQIDKEEMKKVPEKYKSTKETDPGRPGERKM